MKKLLIVIIALALNFYPCGLSKVPKVLPKNLFLVMEEPRYENDGKSSPLQKARDRLGMFSMFKVKDVTLGETKVTGDSATVNVKYTTEDGKQDEFDLNLVKQDGKWLVEIKGK